MKGSGRGGLGAASSTGGEFQVWTLQRQRLPLGFGRLLLVQVRVWLCKEEPGPCSEQQRH